MSPTQHISHKTRGPFAAFCILATVGALLTGCGSFNQKKAKPLAVYQGEDVLVMLPTSSRFAAAGTAVKAGIEAANKLDGKAPEGAGDQAAKLAFVDSVKRGFDKKYRGSDAQLAIGPLVKSSVDVIAADVKMPTLALNKGTVSGSEMLFEYALSPEDEARDMAEKMVKAGKKHIVIFAPKKNRIVDPFVRRLNQQDKTIKTEIVYLDQRGLVSDKRAIEALSVATVDAALAIVKPKPARALIPQIKKNAPGLPIIANRLAFDGEPIKSMRDVFIVDIPWMLEPERRVAFKPSATEYSGFHSRLYAMGVDAYRLAPSMTAIQQEPIVYAGETGTITFRKNGSVGRELSLGRFQDNGLPIVVPIETLAEITRSHSEPANGDK